MLERVNNLIYNLLISLTNMKDPMINEKHEINDIIKISGILSNQS